MIDFKYTRLGVCSSTNLLSRLARLRPAAALRQEVRRGYQVLPQRPQVGQGQPADPTRSVTASDPDARPRGLQGKGKRSWGRLFFYWVELCPVVFNNYL